MEHESTSDILHVAMIGAEKNGKSVLASTAPGVKLYFDFDDRKAAIAGRPGVYAITFRDPKWPRMPESAEEVLDIMTCLEKSLDLSQLVNKKNQRIFPEAKEGTIVQNIMLDSISSFARFMQNHEMYNNEALRRTIKVGPNLEIHVPKNYDAWKAEVEGVLSVIFRCFALPINVFCMFHETAEESPASTDEKPIFTGRVSIFPVRYKAILKYFNEVWRVKLTAIPTQSGQRYYPRVYALPDYSIDAATTMLLDPVEEPDIAKMIAKHKTNLAKVSASAKVAGSSK